MPEFISLNPRVKFLKNNSGQQCCVYCGEIVRISTYGIYMNNKSDKIILRKGLWMHIGCVEKFYNLVKHSFDKHEKEIIARCI